jgi:hypothetical protein
MTLTPEQLAQRGEFGASDMPCVVNGNALQRNTMVRIKQGLEPPEDFTWNWEVQRGVITEPLARKFCEHDLGYQLTRVGEVVRHAPPFDFLTCTLDGFDPVREATVEFKNAWSFDYAIRWYAPQAEAQRSILGVRRAFLMISVQGHKPVEYEVPRDRRFHDICFERLAAIKICVDTMILPHPVEPIAPPEKWRSVDLTSENTNYKDELIEHLVVWASTKLPSDQHAQAAESAKSLVPNDVGRLRFNDITINRNKRGHLSIQQRDAA